MAEFVMLRKLAIVDRHHPFKRANVKKNTNPRPSVAALAPTSQ
jgi:hypothetical protein